jgi:23S rRNA pseudouridine1911/1915/1917 synthase
MARARVEPDAAGSRVDHLVAAAVPGLSVAAARQLVEGGAVRVDGRRARKGERLAAGQVVDVDDEALALRRPGVAPDPDLALEVLYQDEVLVAIAKPSGIPSHPLAGRRTGTAASALVARFPECAAASPDAREGGLVHRLDTATSGVLIAARRADAWRALRGALGAPGAEKTYLAEVAGRPPERGVADQPIGRIGRRGARVRVGGGRRPLPARTTWEVVERRGDRTLVRVRLGAGRAHQVRAHLAAAGFPIVGDPKYGGPEAPELHLHAAAVSFTHPVSGEPISIVAPPPAWAIIRA